MKFLLLAAILLVSLRFQNIAYAQTYGCTDCTGPLTYSEVTYNIEGCDVTIMFSYSENHCGKRYVSIDSIALSSNCGQISHLWAKVGSAVVNNNPMGFANPPYNDCYSVTVAEPACVFPNTDPRTFGTNICGYCCGVFDICFDNGVRTVRLVSAHTQIALLACNSPCEFVCDWPVY